MNIVFRIMYIVGAIAGICSIGILSIFGQEIREILRLIIDNKHESEENRIKAIKLLNNEPTAVGLSITCLVLFLSALGILWNKI